VRRRVGVRGASVSVIVSALVGLGIGVRMEGVLVAYLGGLS
jgi:hypothetical protein